MLAVLVVRTEPVSAHALVNRNECKFLLFGESFKRARAHARAFYGGKPDFSALLNSLVGSV